MVSSLRKITKVLTTIMKYVMVVFFIWMVLSLGVQVFARYIFHKSFVWSEESARYCMIWMIFIGATEVMFNSDHIKVTMIEDALKGIARWAINLVQDVICLIFSVMLVLYSFPQMMLAAKAVSANMDINMGIVFAIFPITTILMTIAYIFRIIVLLVDRTGSTTLTGGGEKP